MIVDQRNGVGLTSFDPSDGLFRDLHGVISSNGTGHIPSKDSEIDQVNLGSRGGSCIDNEGMRSCEVIRIGEFICSTTNSVHLPYGEESSRLDLNFDQLEIPGTEEFERGIEFLEHFCETGQSYLAVDRSVSIQNDPTNYTLKEIKA
ncbi:hypothetical protein QAD02_012719 [Eretmocerus hayati]|uniref:Uncharacterized protein n=1 Tax=Eretmocerus hayati TaxID=131215 RepID=A0ACC2P3C1_9HYME|nr:hypothetical protein QAD02_012719 [Eretmocerus hayati]